MAIGDLNRVDVEQELNGSCDAAHLAHVSLAVEFVPLLLLFVIYFGAVLGGGVDGVHRIDAVGEGVKLIGLFVLLALVLTDDFLGHHVLG